MNWRQRLTDILWDQTIEHGGYVDLRMAVDTLRQECPGDFTIEWNGPGGIDIYETVDHLAVDISFRDDKERVEWLLKWG